MANIWSTIQPHLNFFRIHLLFFTFTPLIFSAIFYAANGRYHISYIDALFNCVSAATVCGLASIDLSLLTGFQQALLFILASIGNPVIVSWMMVYIRRRYFAKRFEYIIEAEIARRKARVERGTREGSTTRRSIGDRFSRVFSFGAGERLSPVAEGSAEDRVESEKQEPKKRRFGIFTKKTLRRLRPDMIRRVDDAPKLVGPNGYISEAPVDAHHHRPRSASVTVAELQEKREKEAANVSSAPHAATINEREAIAGHSTAAAAPGGPILARSPTLQRTPTLPNGNTRAGVPLSHNLTVEFVTPDRDLRGRRLSRERRPSFVNGALSSQHTRSPTGSRRYSTGGSNVVHDDRDYFPPGTVPMTRRATTHHSYHSFRESVRERSSKNTGYGGFPYPTALLLRLFKKLFPGLERRLVRTVTLPNTQTISTYPNTDGSTRNVPYVSFNAIVGRNSKFHLLTEEHLEELGGVEYRALTALLWIVACYHLILQLVGFIIIAPYMSIPRWRSDFQPPNLHRYVPPAWFSAFQVVSAYSNTGMSLVDQSMIPFQEAYPMIFVLAILILAGNTAYPVFLRFMIWCITKCVPVGSRLNETLHFLLDHPRRCFVYLFPSHQTWFLLTIVILLTTTDYFFFLVLDIGNATMEAIPIGVRFAIGILQACAVRSAGFATVSLASLAPAVQTLFVMMMYVSVYPIAMSVRSTNVYEEKSLGIFDDEDDDENEPSTEGPRSAVWGRHLAWHARRQLAFDMWWICLALFLLCIIERSRIQDEDDFQWFTIFALIFELISAYGTVGLSLGIPGVNYSFSGALTPLSKLIICAVMIRGRHRGLPVAIDRAVMLPFEFKKAAGLQDDDEHQFEDGDREDVVAAHETEGYKPERILEEGEFEPEPDSENSGSTPKHENGNGFEKAIVESPEAGTPSQSQTPTPRGSHESPSKPQSINQ